MNDDQIILPVPEGVSRPLWSVMIPVYNRTKYVSQAVESVLAQDPGPDKMQICVVDNSTESIDWKTVLSPEALQRIEIFIQPKSVPGHDNWNTCIRRARGHLVHILHDDDWVADGFYNEVEKMSSETPDAGMFALRSFFVDESGVIEAITGNLCTGKSLSLDISPFLPYNPIQCPGVVVRKSAYEELGGFRGDMLYNIDQEMWMRIISKFGVRYSSEVMVYYRASPGNGTDLYLSSGQNLYCMWDFCTFVTSTYESLAGIDWKPLLLQTAKNQELRFRGRGNLDAAKRSREFWFQKATLKQRCTRLFEDCFKTAWAFVQKLFH